SLPVDACPVVAVEIIPPTPAPVPTEEPAPAPPHVPNPGPSDTTAPTIGQQYAAPYTTLYQGDSTVIHAFAADNVGVSSVLITWAGVQSGSSTMTNAGLSEWTFKVNRGTSPNGNVTFTMRAVDAAGNQSAPVSVVINMTTLD
ncbi:MAG TPA: hypothetical protein VNS80_09430, partial [Pseudolysinimonas sp.]|nr:hypothetical protein [Pseudolysinimonas sp.]